MLKKKITTELKLRNHQRNVKKTCHEKVNANTKWRWTEMNISLSYFSEPCCNSMDFNPNHFCSLFIVRTRIAISNAQKNIQFFCCFLLLFICLLVKKMYVVCVHRHYAATCFTYSNTVSHKGSELNYKNWCRLVTWRLMQMLFAYEQNHTFLTFSTYCFFKS